MDTVAIGRRMEIRLIMDKRIAHLDFINYTTVDGRKQHRDTSSNHSIGTSRYIEPSLKQWSCVFLSNSFGIVSWSVSSFAQKG